MTTANILLKWFCYCNTYTHYFADSQAFTELLVVSSTWEERMSCDTNLNAWACWYLVATFLLLHYSNEHCCMISFLKLVQEFELHPTLSSQTKISDRLKGGPYVTIKRLIRSSVLSCNFMVDCTSTSSNFAWKPLIHGSRTQLYVSTMIWLRMAWKTTELFFFFKPAVLVAWSSWKSGTVSAESNIDECCHNLLLIYPFMATVCCNYCRIILEWIETYNNCFIRSILM